MPRVGLGRGGEGVGPHPGQWGGWKDPALTVVRVPDPSMVGHAQAGAVTVNLPMRSGRTRFHPMRHVARRAMLSLVK